MKILSAITIFLIISSNTNGQNSSNGINTIERYNKKFMDTCAYLIDSINRIKSNNESTKLCALIDTIPLLDFLQEEDISVERCSIIEMAKDFVRANDSICVKVQSGTFIYSHIYELMDQWQDIYYQLQVYVFPPENIYERQERQIQDLDNKLDKIRVNVDILSKSKILNDATVNKPIDSIIILLDSIKGKMPFTNAPDYSTTFNSMSGYLLRIDNTSKSTDSIIRSIGTNISAIKAELI